MDRTQNSKSEMYYALILDKCNVATEINIPV